MKRLLISFIFFTILLTGCSANKIANIEAENNYIWQRYMSEDEFNNLRKDISYMKIVEIAGGEGELVEEDPETGKKMYAWPDELLMTQAYEITFVDDRLTRKQKVERSGVSKRIVETKKPAVPGSN